MKQNIPDWLFRMLSNAMLGEIYPAIRGIAVSLTEEGHLRLRMYLDRIPTEYDLESIDTIATNLDAAIGKEKISKIDIECEFSERYSRDIESLDGFVYFRREYDD